MTSLAPRRRRCTALTDEGHCQQVVVQKYVKPKALGARPVLVALCMVCDRGRCSACGNPVPSPTSVRCSCGASVALTVKP